MIALVAVVALGADLPTVGLVPLDAAPGQDSAQLHLTIRGIAGAMQAEGGVVPVFDDDLALLLGEDAKDRLDSARESLAEGRRMLAEGDGDIALAFLQESVTAHSEAGSDVVRREEAADAHFALARAFLGSYDRDAARGEIRRAIQLVPDYMQVRADTVTPELRQLADEATQSLVGRPVRHLSTGGAADLAAELDVDVIVYGTVDAKGDLSITVQRGSTIEYIVERPGPFKAPPVGDAWYRPIAAQIVAASLGEPVPEWTPPPVSKTPVEPVGGNPPPVDPPPTVVGPQKPRATWAAWTAAGVLLAGAGVGVYVATLPEPAAPTETWSLTVE